ncbi:MAG: 50S ribosomal protein L29 [Rickettsiales bacterium]|nr:50S ribosomal protein L29 [Rickettsiales bacterium]MCA0253974.1 50S ribosomal protein L29 [Pseudomonadota bacterium]
MSEKKLTTKTISGLSIEKLKEKEVFLKKELFNLRFQRTLGELTNTARFSNVRKDIARIKTELTKRKAGGSK